MKTGKTADVKAAAALISDAEVQKGINFSLLISVALLSGVISSAATYVIYGGSMKHDLAGFIGDEQLFTRVEGFKSGVDAMFRTMTTDLVRDYWDGRPCNSGWKFDGIEYGSKEHWDDVTARKYKVEYHIPAWAEFEKWKGKKVLEVGGGICTTATSFAKAGAFITVADLSPKSMELCKQRFKTMGLEHMAKFYVVNAEKLSEVIPVEQYDLIWSFGVIHHSPNPEHIVAQMKKYMNQKTVLKLMVYSKISMKLFWVMNHTKVWDFAKMDELVAHYSEAREGSPVTYTYSNEGAKQLLKDMTITYMGKTHIFPYEIGPYKRNTYVVERFLRGLTSERWAELEDELGWHLLVEARIPAPTDSLATTDDAPIPVCHKRFAAMRGVLP